MTGPGQAFGGPDADILVGGGPGKVMYSTSNAGVAVNLATGRGYGGGAQGDVISGVTQIIGSNHDDTLTETLRTASSRGADAYDGGAGINVVSYHGSREGLTVNLGIGKASGGDAESADETKHDAFVSIENLWGARTR